MATEESGFPMYRRIISSCVLAGFLVAQWAAIPHAHAEGNPLDHDTAPHAHFSAVGGLTHDHDHQHGTHDHCHATPIAARDSISPDSGASSVPDHDLDAVYLPSTGSITATCGVEHGKLAATPVVFHAFDSVLFFGTLNDTLVAAACPSSNYASSCALYLALRTLRI